MNFDLNRALGSLQNTANAAISKSKEALQEAGASRQDILRMQRDIKNLANALDRVQGPQEGGGSLDHIRYIEQIPGRRVPFDLLVQIPIGANISSVQSGTTTISQNGPFVATARFATFQSAYQFNYTDPETGAVSDFKGRSFGRFRPIHSVTDVLDGKNDYSPSVNLPLPGSGSPLVASPSNNSNFRSMQFDGLIQFLDEGDGYPRSNLRVPSSFYVQETNTPFYLGALDFFEKGSVLRWEVTPLHVNNPAYGNVSNIGGATGVYPFIDSQYDVHEGITDAVITDQTSDPIQRLPDGILTIGFHGYKIIQPPGVVRPT